MFYAMYTYFSTVYERKNKLCMMEANGAHLLVSLLRRSFHELFAPIYHLRRQMLQGMCMRICVYRGWL